MTSSDIDEKKFPRVREATPLYVVQESGDAIFVPSGWYHQVTNLEDTMSINHNWFNGYNVVELWRFFQREYAAVKAELEDLKELGLDGKEFRDQCQIVMNANTGINYIEFQDLLTAKERDLVAQLAAPEDDSMSAAQRKAMLEHLETVRTAKETVLEGSIAPWSDVPLCICHCCTDPQHSKRTSRLFPHGVVSKKSRSLPRTERSNLCPPRSQGSVGEALAPSRQSARYAGNVHCEPLDCWFSSLIRVNAREAGLSCRRLRHTFNHLLMIGGRSPSWLQWVISATCGKMWGRVTT